MRNEAGWRLHQARSTSTSFQRFHIHNIDHWSDNGFYPSHWKTRVDEQSRNRRWCKISRSKWVYSTSMLKERTTERIILKVSMCRKNRGNNRNKGAGWRMLMEVSGAWLVPPRVLPVLRQGNYQSSCHNGHELSVQHKIQRRRSKYRLSAALTASSWRFDPWIT